MLLSACVKPEGATLGVPRVNWRSADPRFLAAVKAAVAADYSDNELRAERSDQKCSVAAHLVGALRS